MANRLSGKVDPSNWGRWGTDDERGALNLLRPEVVKRAVGLVKKGEAVSLGRPISQHAAFRSGRLPPTHLMILDGADFAAGLELPGGYQWADDVIILKAHGTVTHIDALSHLWYDDKLYNNHDPNLIRSDGAARCGIEKVGAIAGRGVLLDVAGLKDVAHLSRGYVITPEDLEACCDVEGVSVQSGDIALIRTGYMQVFYKDLQAFNAGQPGIGVAAARWLSERDVCAVGADNVTLEFEDSGAGEGGAIAAVHKMFLRDCGIYIMELLDLDRLAEAKAYEFLFVGAPLKIVGGVGSPLNPVAII